MSYLHFPLSFSFQYTQNKGSFGIMIQKLGFLYIYTPLILVEFQFPY